MRHSYCRGGNDPVEQMGADTGKGAFDHELLKLVARYLSRLDPPWVVTPLHSLP